MEFTRICPKCGKTVSHKNDKACKKAQRVGCACMSCSQLTTRKILTPEMKLQILSLIREGTPYKDIAKQFFVGPTRISQIATKAGIRVAYKRKITSPGFAECRICNQIKPAIEFPKEGTSSCCVCKSSKRIQAINANVEKLFEKRVQTIKKRARKKNVAFGLETKDLIEIWEKQKGLCFYTDREMTRLLGQRREAFETEASLDRIIPDKGYVAGNVVFCINLANRVKQNLTLEEMAQWMPGWHQRIMDFLALAIEPNPGRV